MSQQVTSIKSDGSYKQLIRLALPIMLGILISQINFATNTFFLGKYNTSDLAANGVASIYYMVFTMLMVGLCSGVQIVLSRRAGEDNHIALGRTFVNAAHLGIALSVTCLLLGILVAKPLFLAQINDDLVRTHATGFSKIRLLGLPLFFGLQLCNQFFISTGQSKYILICMVVSTATNILLDYLLIFGNFGVPPYGLNGAAWASISAEFVYLLVAASIIIFRRQHITYKINLIIRPDYGEILKILKLASPVMLQYFFSIGSWELFYIYIEHLGTKELAVSQILRSVFGIAGASSWALASSCNATVSNVIGQGKLNEVSTVVKRAITVSVGVSASIGCLLLLMPESFLRIYTSDTQLINLAQEPLIVVVISNVLLAASTVVFNSVAGTGSTRQSMLIELSAVSVYILYCYIVIERSRMSLSWAWGSEFFYWIFLLCCSALYLKYGNWRKKSI